MNGTDVVERLRTDPVALASVLWPQIVFYDRQVEIIRSVDENPETFVHAGNMLR